MYLYSFFIPSLLFLFNLSMENIDKDQFLRTVIGYPQMLTLTTIGFFAYKKSWHLVDLNTMQIRNKTLAIFIIILFQAFFITFFNITLIFDNSKLAFISTSQYKIVINLFLSLNLIGTVISIKRLFHMAKNVDDLFLSYQAQRHDFHHHLQNIYSMVQASGNNEAKKYLDSMLDDFEELNELIRLKNPAVAALLKAKIAFANSKNIKLEISIVGEFFVLKTILKVIIAEDDAITRSYLKDLLTKINNVRLVGEAKNGNELIEMVQTQEPDILLVDFEMPELNGLDAVKNFLTERDKRQYAIS